MTSTAHKLQIKKPNGAAILISMLSLLLICSLAVVSGAKSVKSNNVIVKNQIFGDQAFEASEAGVEFGLVHLKSNSSTILTDSDSDGFIDAYAPSTTTNVDNGNNTAYTITYSNPTASSFDLTQLSINGTSDATNTSKTINQLAIRIPFMENTPPAGFITHSGVSLGGNVTIVNITNTATGNTIWSGGPVSLTGSADTTCGVGCGSDRNNTNSDITENDSQLSTLTGDEFFLNFFGVNKATAEANADITLNYTSDQNLSSVLDPDSNDGKSIWINQNGGTASLSGNSTIGSQDNPVILIIDGNFIANGNTDIYGVVYVTQDWNNTGGGTLTIHGAVIVEGAYNGNGTPNVIYDSLTLNNTNNIAEFAKVPGSWHDF